METVDNILEEVRRKVDALQAHERARQRELHIRATHLAEMKTRNEDLTQEVARLREYVHRLVAHIKRIEGGLATLDSAEVARRLHEHNNSWLVPDKLERRIYEEAVDQMGDLIKEIVALPPVPPSA